MSTLERITTHVEDGLARSIEAFKNKPKFENLLQIVLARMQHIEDVLWDVYTGVWLDNAEGTQLDGLGWIVGEPRKGRQDDQYRLWVRARIALNRTNGKIGDSLRLVRLVLESGATVRYVPEYPAGYRIEIENSAVALSELYALLNEARPAGVALHVVSAGDEAVSLILDDATAPSVDGTTNGLDAGLMADMI